MEASPDRKIRMIVLYNIVMVLGITVGLPVIIPNVLVSTKRRKTVLKRLGLKGLPGKRMQTQSQRPEEKPIWVHALSVGEAISAEPLVKGLKKRFAYKEIVLSVSTYTGYEIATRRLREDVSELFFFPYDFAPSVRRITKRIDPSIVLIVESDIWPNFLLEMKRRNVPVLLVNARLSQRSFQGYKRFSFFMETIFLAFSKICAQTHKDAQRLEYLGVPSRRIHVTGNLKFDREYDSVSGEELGHFRRSMNIGPVQRILVAGSTHKGEEEVILDAFLKIKIRFSDLLLIIAPRDPGRAGPVCRIFRSAGLCAYHLQDMGRLEAGRRLDVIVVDTIGVLRKLYALADLAFVGGSLVNSGGHNPLEPAMFSKPLLFGPDMSDFKQMSEMLLDSGGAILVRDAESFCESATMLLEDSESAKTMGKKAFNMLYTNRGAVEKTLEVIESCYDQ